MLRFLSIKRLAVIDALEVEFEAGLNVLTGETGAGKSILVEAVGLLLGGRASGDLVRTGEDAASIEAIFESDGEEILVRRELTAQGRSRAFINGSLATAGALKELSARLIEIHGQHEHQTLLDPSTHLAMLDSFGALDPLLAPTSAAYEMLRGTDAALERLRTALADRDARQELAAFHLRELDAIAPKAGEDDALRATRQVLASAERVERLCADSYASLYESDGAVLSTLGAVWRRVGELAALDPQFQPYLDARDGIKSQLQDLATFLRRYADSVQASPARLQETDDRLAQLERLKRKHGPTLDEVLAKWGDLRRELSDLTRSDERLAELAAERRRAVSAYRAAAEALSRERTRAAAAFARGLEGVLSELAMADTRFEVRFNVEPLPEAAWRADGIDQVEFFVSPNPGEDLRPLARIVSGGELSRIMLAIKAVTATSRHGFSADADRPPSGAAPGLIFDEVDAGIGGRVADVVGRHLRTLGSAFQVLCITHLPQIAARADTHFHIEKQVESGRTRTTVRRLDAAGRIDEVGRMLGGALTDAVRRTAREMLETRGPAGPPPAGRGPAKGRGESERAKAKGHRGA